MKKNILTVFNRKKDILAAVNTKKDVYAASGKRKSILAFFRNKIKFIAILLILILAAAILVNYLSSKEASKEKSSKEQKTEFVQKDEAEIDAEAEDSDTGNLENHLGSDFIKTLKSGNYMIKYRTTTVYDGKSFEVETTYAVSGKSIAMVSQDRATIVKDNKVYMLNHVDKTIISWDVDHSSNNLKRIDTEGLAYLGSSKEGNLLCEEYATSLTNIKLYFDGKELVKMSPDMNRQDIIMDIVEVSKEVPETMFQVPTGYKTTEL